MDFDIPGKYLNCHGSYPHYHPLYTILIHIIPPCLVILIIQRSGIRRQGHGMTAFRFRDRFTGKRVMVSFYQHVQIPNRDGLLGLVFAGTRTLAPANVHRNEYVYIYIYTLYISNIYIYFFMYVYIYIVMRVCIYIYTNVNAANEILWMYFAYRQVCIVFSMSSRLISLFPCVEFSYIRMFVSIHLGDR